MELACLYCPGERSLPVIGKAFNLAPPPSSIPIVLVDWFDLFSIEAHGTPYVPGPGRLLWNLFPLSILTSSDWQTPRLLEGLEFKSSMKFFMW